MKNIEKDNLPADIKKDLEKIENEKIDKQLKTSVENNSKGDLIIENNKRSTSEYLLDFKEEIEHNNDELTVKLKKNSNGREKITLNPDKITGTTLNNIEKMWRSKNRENREMVKELDGDYLAMVASIMSEVPYSEIMDLGGNDFTQLISKTRNFLLVD